MNQVVYVPDTTPSPFNEPLPIVHHEGQHPDLEKSPLLPLSVNYPKFLNNLVDLFGFFRPDAVLTFPHPPYPLFSPISDGERSQEIRFREWILLAKRISCVRGPKSELQRPFCVFSETQPVTASRSAMSQASSWIDERLNRPYWQAMKINE